MTRDDRDNVLQFDEHAADGLDDVAPRMIDLGRVAKQLDLSRDALREMSVRGEFVPIVWLSPRRARVRVDDLREWLRERELGGDPTERRAEFMRAAGRGSAMPRLDRPSRSRKKKNAARRPEPTSRAAFGVGNRPNAGSVAGDDEEREGGSA